MISDSLHFVSNNGADKWLAKLYKRAEKQRFDFHDLGRRCMLYLNEITPYRGGVVGRPKQPVSLRDSYYLKSGEYWWSINSSLIDLFRWIDLGTQAHAADKSPFLHFPDTRSGYYGWYVITKPNMVRGINPHFLSSKVRDYLFHEWTGGSPIIGELYY